MRAILNEVTTKEKKKVETLSEGVEKLTKEEIQNKMKLILDSLVELEIEVGDFEGLEIKIEEQGSKALIRSKMPDDKGLTTDTLAISTNADKTALEIEQHHYDSYFGSYDENKKEYNSIEPIIAIVVNLVGKHIGSQKGCKNYC